MTSFYKYLRLVGGDLTLLEILLKYFGFGAASPHLFLRRTVIYTPGIERTTLRSSS